MDNHTVTLLMEYRYWIILPLAFVEGPIIAVLLGFLCSLHLFAILPVFLILSGWDCVRDLFFYYLGRFSHHRDFIKRYSKKLSLSEKHFSLLEALWKNHSFKTMIFSKFAFGISPVLIMTAGVAKMTLRHFAQAAFSVSIVEYAAFLVIGYYFGEGYLTLSSHFAYTQYVIALGVILLLAGYILFVRKARHFFKESTGVSP